MTYKEDLRAFVADMLDKIDTIVSPTAQMRAKASVKHTLKELETEIN